MLVSTGPIISALYYQEGGISTPFIVSWPGRITASAIVDEPVHLIDIAATCFDAASAAYPKEFNDAAISALEGESLLPLIYGREWAREQPIFWEHEGNRAVRLGQWKLVSKHPGGWELYDMEEDRTELNDRASSEPARVRELSKLHDEWAARVGVLPWPVVPEVTAEPGSGRHVHVVG